MFEEKNRLQLTWTHADTDYTTGVGQIPYTVVIPSGDWRPYVRDNEPQKLKFDTDGCSQFSPMTSSVEAQLNYCLDNNLFSPEALQFFNTNGYIVNGQFQLSIEFNAILSGTTINGNNPINFALSVKNDGIIPQSMLQMTIADSQQYATQQDQDAVFYSRSRVTPAMTDLGKKSLNYFKAAFQWVGNTDGSNNTLETLKTYLKQSPLTIGIAVPTDVSQWNQTLVKWDGGKQLQHCVGIIYIDPTVPYVPFADYIHDNYNPYIKQLSSDYWISQVLQIVIYPQTPAMTSNPAITGVNLPIGLIYGNVGISVYQLQRALIQGGFGSFIPTGFFGIKTETALLAYQQVHGLQKTGYVDAATALYFKNNG